MVWPWLWQYKFEIYHTLQQCVWYCYGMVFKIHFCDSFWWKYLLPLFWGTIIKIHFDQRNFRSVISDLLFMNVCNSKSIVSFAKDKTIDRKHFFSFGNNIINKKISIKGLTYSEILTYKVGYYNLESMVLVKIQRRMNSFVFCLKILIFIALIPLSLWFKYYFFSFFFKCFHMFRFSNTASEIFIDL